MRNDNGRRAARIFLNGMNDHIPDVIDAAGEKRGAFLWGLFVGIALMGLFGSILWR